VFQVPPVPPPHASTDTRARLLEAAAAIFSEEGFRAASVRQICQRAGANVAAIHYHFGGKEELYLELLRELGRRSFERYPPTLGLGANPTPEERLFAFVHAFLLRVLSEDGFGRHGRLLSREMVDPSPAFERVVEEFIRPHFEHLCGIVIAIRGRGSNEAEVRLAARSIVAQCAFYHHARALLERLSPGEPRDPSAIRALAEHVTRFSLEGLRQKGRKSA
jgi:AcrR family transcriptional regulator